MSLFLIGRYSQNFLIIYIYIYIYIYIFWLIGQVCRVFANGPKDLGSIPVCVIPNTFKMVLDTSLLNTQQYKVRIKGKVEQSREKSSAPSLHLSVVVIEKEAFWSSCATVANLLMYIYIYIYIYMYIYIYK